MQLNKDGNFSLYPTYFLDGDILSVQLSPRAMKNGLGGWRNVGRESGKYQNKLRTFEKKVIYISQRFFYSRLPFENHYERGECVPVSSFMLCRKILISSALGSYFVNWKNELYMKNIIIYEMLFLKYLSFTCLLWMTSPNPKKRCYINED